MFTKEFPQNGGPAKVTFELPAEVQGDAVYLVGDFNDWKLMHPMMPGDDCWRCSLELSPGCEYQYRFLVRNDNDKSWLNDPAADTYIPNPFGSDNSVIVVVKPEA